MTMLPCHPPCLLLTLLTGRPKCTTTTTTSFVLSLSAASSMILIARWPVESALMHMSRGCMISPRALQESKEMERSKEEHEHWMSKEQKKLQKMADKAKQKQLIKDWKEWWRNKKAWSSCQAQVDAYDKLLHQAPTPECRDGGTEEHGEETGGDGRWEMGGDGRREETGDGRRRETGGDGRREETGDGRRREMGGDGRQEETGKTGERWGWGHAK
ncbi:hypothetical protein BD769DRAFT_1390485 [Suillus cothurnatus]|nr:hypothetical protein BD769DRAFT_1390485 [Suillus cothurnatus]